MAADMPACGDGVAGEDMLFGIMSQIGMPEPEVMVTCGVWVAGMVGTDRLRTASVAGTGVWVGNGCVRVGIGDIGATIVELGEAGWQAAARMVAAKAKTSHFLRFSNLESKMRTLILYFQI
jgi:hypothetical protein